MVVQVRLENVFLSVRPIVLSLARATMFSSTTLFSSSCSVQRRAPWAASSRPGRSASLRCRRRRSAPAASRAACVSTPPRNPLRPVAGGRAQLSPGWCAIPQRSGCRSMPRLLRKHRPSAGCALAAASRRVLAGTDQRLQPLALLGAQRDDILLHRNLLGRHHRLRRFRCDGIESQKDRLFKLIEATATRGALKFPCRDTGTRIAKDTHSINSGDRS